MRWWLACGLVLTACARPRAACLGALPLSEAECAQASAMRLPAALTPARDNSFADDEAAAALGQRVFFNRRLSSSAAVACGTCHEPGLRFASRLPRAIGIGEVTRNAPPIIDVARLEVFFWDGRVDRLWKQPVQSFENPLEMNVSRLDVLRTLRKDEELRAMYEGVFGAFPVDADADRFIDDLGRAIEAYERKLISRESPLDRFLDGETDALDEEERRGLTLFASSAGCTACHAGPMLSDQRFHAIGPDSSDRGRGDGTFRTPPLRSSVKAPPYGHDGSLATLEDAIRFHGTSLSDADITSLSAFLQAAGDGISPPLPWSDWPQL